MELNPDYQSRNHIINLIKLKDLSLQNQKQLNLAFKKIYK
jgi:hypothetical protein